MTKEEYIKLFHEAEVNLVAFKPVFHCDDELRKMVEMAIEKEREAIEKRVMELDETMATRVNVINNAIRARG